MPKREYWLEKLLFFPLKEHGNIPTCSPTNTQSISFCFCYTHTHIDFTVHGVIYSEGRGSAFIQMCASLNASPQKDKNQWPVVRRAHRHWHALHQAKESLFSISLLVPAFHSPFLLHLLPSYLSKAKETETEVQRGEVAPHVLLSLQCRKAEFHLRMFRIVFRWIKLPQPERVGCEIFGWAAIHRFTNIV